PAGRPGHGCSPGSARPRRWASGRRGSPSRTGWSPRTSRPPPRSGGRSCRGSSVVYYGGHPKVEYDFGGLRAPVLGHWAEHDDFANANIPWFEKELGLRGKPFAFHTYPGTKHAFFNDARPE